MRNCPDPSVHRHRERQILDHVKHLIDDERFRLDTTRGYRSVAPLPRQIDESDRGVELKRMMAAKHMPDRDLEAQMPTGASLHVLFSLKSWFRKTPVARLQVVCVTPMESLLDNESPKPLSVGETRRAISDATLQAPKAGADVPTTLVIVSTSGFTLEAHELADRQAQRTTILIEPNDAGGWNIYGPVETKALTDLFDPELEESKKQRVIEYIELNKVDLLGAGIASDKLAAKLQLPLQTVEWAVKLYAQEKPGLTASRVDGRVVLFQRNSAQPAGDQAGGGSEMPFLERVKALFSRKGDNDKKIALLAERRIALSQQRDRMYEDMASLEEKESVLREQCKNAASAITKRRLAGQLVQLRKDIERRTQMLNVLSQQINVVSTALHNLELLKQGQAAKLPDTEELSAGAAETEEMLAQLQAESEVADSVGAITGAGVSDEEQAILDELERESAAEAAQQSADAGQAPATGQKQKSKAAGGAQASSQPHRDAEPAADDSDSSAADDARRSEPEAG